MLDQIFTDKKIASQFKPEKQEENAAWVFMKNWCTHPMTTAAQTPSSRYLGDAMVQAVIPNKKGPVVEFGPGTGAITDRILDHGVDLKDLILVEMNADFCRYLRSRYRGATIIQNDALGALNYLKGTRANGVISGMPLIQFPKKDRIIFAKKCLTDLVEPGGKLAQFTYFFESPLVLGKCSKIQAERSKRIWRNLWPAVVWTYQLEDQKNV